MFKPNPLNLRSSMIDIFTKAYRTLSIRQRHIFNQQAIIKVRNTYYGDAKGYGVIGICYEDRGVVIFIDLQQIHEGYDIPEFIEIISHKINYMVPILKEYSEPSENDDEIKESSDDFSLSKLFDEKLYITPQKRTGSISKNKKLTM